MKKMIITPIVTAVLSALLIGSIGISVGSETEQHQAQQSTTASQTKTARKVLYWYDPMTPSQRFDKPGKSPFMDMPLVPRYADEEAEDGGISISAREQQNLGVRLGTVSQQTLYYKLDAFATVDINERSVKIIPASANGIVEKLYVNAQQQKVTQGQPLATLWIPDWTSSQKEYLAVRQLHDKALTAAARSRLQLQFMPESMIKLVEKTGKPQTRITVYSPISGYVNKLNVHEGQQVAASQALFELYSLNPVWIVVDYPQTQADLLPLGSQVNATSESWPGEVFHGTVSELLPNIDAITRNYQARVVLGNPQQHLKPGMYLNIQLSQPITKNVLAIPQESLIVSSHHNTVIITDGKGHFKPVDITTGQEQDGWVEVKHGLVQGQQIVTSGQFLIDSEASLLSALPALTDSTDNKSTKKTEKNTITQKHATVIKDYAANGVIKSITSGQLVIAHQAIAELKWPAMTMNFQLPPTMKTPSLIVGEKIMFRFKLGDNGAIITQLMVMSQPVAHDERGHKS